MTRRPPREAHPMWPSCDATAPVHVDAAVPSPTRHIRTSSHGERPSGVIATPPLRPSTTPRAETSRVDSRPCGGAVTRFRHVVEPDSHPRDATTNPASPPQTPPSTPRPTAIDPHPDRFSRSATTRHPRGGSSGRARESCTSRGFPVVRLDASRRPLSSLPHSGRNAAKRDVTRLTPRRAVERPIPQHRRAIGRRTQLNVSDYRAFPRWALVPSWCYDTERPPETLLADYFSPVNQITWVQIPDGTSSSPRTSPTTS